MAGLMNAFRVEEDMPTESGMLTRSLVGAQKKVETYYYGILKHVYEYDELMNNKRKTVYAERRRVLEGRELKAFLQEQVRNAYEIKEGQVEQISHKPDARSRALLNPPANRHALARTPAGDCCPARIGGTTRLRVKGSAGRVQEGWL